ncbi:hypothetical protein FD755_017810 [Muntiacus reevesi]|uniref:HTH CENPB-type domain-containing protein n=1 Tax=Muntiacus reevesi TaxID=9886 RepID=A0A5N3XB77_MUNRE|nr:hypothetical protein FD755_017810 [Muntiacus reevesi]
MIKLNEKGPSKANIGQKLDLLSQTFGRLMDTNEKFLREMKSTAPEVLVVWIDDQTSHNIPLSQSLIQSKALTVFISMKAERSKEAAKEKLEASRGWFMKFKERNCLCNIIVQGEATSADVEATAGYPKDLAHIINESRLREKAMPGFKASKHRLTVLLGAKEAGDLRLKPVLIYRSENSRDFKNYAKSTLLCSYSEKKIPLLILLFIGNALGHPRALMEMYSEIHVPMDQGVILMFKSNDLKYTSYKSVVALDSDSSDDSRQRLWKKLIPTLVDDFEGFKNSMEELLLMYEQRKWFLQMESTPGEDVKIADVTAKGLDYYMNLVDKSGFKRIAFSFERSFTVGKMLSNSFAHYREIVHERKSQSMPQTSVLSHFKKLTWTPQLSAATTLISQHPSTLKQDLFTSKKIMTH